MCCFDENKEQCLCLFLLAPANQIKQEWKQRERERERLSVGGSSIENEKLQDHGIVIVHHSLVVVEVSRRGFSNHRVLSVRRTCEMVHGLDEDLWLSKDDLRDENRLLRSFGVIVGLG